MFFSNCLLQIKSVWKRWDCGHLYNEVLVLASFLFCFFTGKAKQMEDKMVQRLQEDVEMGDEDNLS